MIILRIVATFGSRKPFQKHSSNSSNSSSNSNSNSSKIVITEQLISSKDSMINKMDRIIDQGEENHRWQKISFTIITMITIIISHMNNKIILIILILNLRLETEEKMKNIIKRLIETLRVVVVLDKWISRNSQWHRLQWEMSLLLIILREWIHYHKCSLL